MLPLRFAGLTRQSPASALSNVAMPSSKPLPNPIIPSKFQSNPRKFFPKNISCILQSFLNISSQSELVRAVSSLEHLSRKGIRLPTPILARLLQQCASTRSLKLGKWVHLHLKLTGLKKPDTLLGNSLIGMYAACGDRVGAYRVFAKMSVRNLFSWNNVLSGYVKSGLIQRAEGFFNKMPAKDVVSWNTMVVGFAQRGHCNEAFQYYKEFRKLGIGYNQYSFAGLLSACVKFKDLGTTRQAHGQVLVAGFLLNMVISSTVVDAYAKCGEMVDARKFFDEMSEKDVFSWTTMVSGYALSGNMGAAKEYFDLMPYKNPVSWTALISGYARHGVADKSLDLFREMIVFRVIPDQFTFSSCLCACASMALLKHGKQIHAYLIRMNFRLNTIVVSSLIDMYSKCGKLEVGRLVFDTIGNKPDIVLWNTMISALAHHGHGEEAIQMCDEMVKAGVKPDGVTLLVILNACSHSGLEQVGLRLFDSMTCDHSIVLSQDHYVCLIDLLGKAGHFDKLIKHLEKMPCEPNDQIMEALVGVCGIPGNIDLVRKFAEQFLESNPQSSSAYLLLSSVYAALGRSGFVEKVKQND